MKWARRSNRASVWGCAWESGRQGITYSEVKNKDKQQLRAPVRGPLPWERTYESRWRRISWVEVCHLASVSTNALRRIFCDQRSSASGEAVLDTNLSSANKSQAHQPEWCSWQHRWSSVRVRSSSEARGGERVFVSVVLSLHIRVPFLIWPS